MSALETIEIKNGLHILLLKVELSIEQAASQEAVRKRKAQRETLARAITHMSLMDDAISHHEQKERDSAILREEIMRLKKENEMLKEQLKF